ncbi:MAG: HAD family hydrolase [Terracidiphilus sp.]
MSLRAVVFDYGMVLSGPPDPEAHAALARIAGLTAERLDNLYWIDRLEYDAGNLTGLEFWRKLACDASLSLDESAIEELIEWDARMWTTENRSMLAWQMQLKQHGLLTAILSNMAEDVLANMLREYDWLTRFDVLVWSYRLHIIKPDAAIYRHTLEQLGTQPEDTLLIDDRPVNVEGARAVGMRGIVFSTVEQLRADLIAAGFDKQLPLP